MGKGDLRQWLCKRLLPATPEWSMEPRYSDLGGCSHMRTCAHTKGGHRLLELTAGSKSQTSLSLPRSTETPPHPYPPPVVKTRNPRVSRSDSVPPLVALPGATSRVPAGRDPRSPSSRADPTGPRWEGRYAWVGSNDPGVRLPNPGICLPPPPAQTSSCGSEPGREPRWRDHVGPGNVGSHDIVTKL